MIKITRPYESFNKIEYGEPRINERIVQVMEDLTNNPQKTIFSASGSRSRAKAAYRMLENSKFTLDKLQQGVAAKTIETMADESVILFVQDTMDVNYNTHKKTAGLGYSSEKVLGVKVHSCLALTEKGIPIGVMSQDCFTREIAKDKTNKSEKSKRPIEEKESNRWLETMRKTTAQIPENITAITICDRECDIYEFYNEAENLDEKFIVRIVNNRVTDSGEKIRSVVKNGAIYGTVNVNIPRDSRRNISARNAEMEIRFMPINLKKPTIRKEAHIADLVTLNVVHIVEKNPLENCEPIEWFLATNLPISNAIEAYKIVQYYVQRWKIERFHHVLKSGCNIEKIQQRSYDKIVPMLLMYSVIAAYILAMTIIAQEDPDATCDYFFLLR